MGGRLGSEARLHWRATDGRGERHSKIGGAEDHNHHATNVKGKDPKRFTARSGDVNIANTLRFAPRSAAPSLSGTTSLPNPGEQLRQASNSGLSVPPFVGGLMGHTSMRRSGLSFLR